MIKVNIRQHVLDCLQTSSKVAQRDLYSKKKGKIVKIRTEMMIAKRKKELKNDKN